MELEQIIVEKKNGTYEPYDFTKILNAVNQSAIRARGDAENTLTPEESWNLQYLIEQDLSNLSHNEITTQYLHALCEKYLSDVAPDVGQAYSNYHSYRMSQAKLWEQVMGRCRVLVSDSQTNEVLEEKKQNANADSTLASTKKCFFADYTAEAFWNEFFLTKKWQQMIKDGEIYAHDKNGRALYPVNCCLALLGYVMKHGCVMNGIPYNTPKSLDKAFDVIGDLILMCASQQYGGFTVPRIDTIMAPYAEMSYQEYLNKYLKLGVVPEKAEQQAYEDVKQDMYDGFQGLEIKLNTVASSRGDYPFTTISFGIDNSRWGRLASIAALDTRRKGQGKKGKKQPVLFPKLVFLYDENLHGKGKPMEDVFEAGIRCSSKAMYPDWLSLTGEGYVPSMYKKYGEVISPMGCRAFLSPWYERGGMDPADENDRPIFEGRFNIGVFSLNLPLIYANAEKKSVEFFTYLDERLQAIREMHQKTYEWLSHMKASINPVMFCYGGFLGGHLKPEDEIGPVLKSSTASFGITALNELEQLHHKKSLHEDCSFSLEVMKHINQKLDEYKHEDGILYAVYGTPAEKLCHTQVQQFREHFGIIKNVSDREYVSNSFHDHVTENITPIEKQNDEKRLWDYFNGGKIQYCKYPINYNLELIRTLVRRAMNMGFYEGVNMSLCFCDDCGYQNLSMGLKCPKCGSVHITQIDRMNGYLGYSRQGKDARIETDNAGNEVIKIYSRFSPHKDIEIKERVSM